MDPKAIYWSHHVLLRASLNLPVVSTVDIILDPILHYPPLDL